MKKLLCLLLALIMCFGPAANVFAASNSKKYVSDIKIGYGDSGKQALINAGYKVNENFNANKDGRGDSVWIGFLETDDPLEAITDVSLMRMNGSYSFADWENELKLLQENVDALLNDFMRGIKEFRTNFAAHSPYAEYALDMLNCFIDDEFTGEYLGDLFLSKKTSDEDIYNVFLMGNMKFVVVIEMCIAMACTEWTDPEDTFVTRLSTNAYAKEYDLSANHDRALINTALQDLHDELVEDQDVVDSYKSVYELLKDDYESLDDYVEQTASDSEYLTYIEYTGLVDILKNIVFNSSGSGSTMYDLVMKESDQWVEEDFETLRLAMTPGQIGVLSAVSLKNLFIYEKGVHDGDIEDKMDMVMEDFYDLDVEEVSVYYGVDTSVYTDPSSVALTSAARREMDSSNISSFGAKKEEGEDPEWLLPTIAFLIVGGVCVAVFGAGLVYRALTKVVLIEAEESAIANGALKVGTLFPASTAAIVTAAVAIFGILMAVAGAILWINYEKSEYKEPDDITYKKIPRAIVDLKETDGEKIYYTYTAAKRIDSNESSENSLEIYGDLNAYNKKNEWVAVYYSKNRDLGDPITSEVLVNPTKAPTSGYTALHEFGLTAATDLNKCNSGKDSKEIYAYVKTTSFPAAGGSSQSGSAFSSGSLILYTAFAFAAGAGIAAGITYNRTKKKYLRQA